MVCERHYKLVWPAYLTLTCELFGRVISSNRRKLHNNLIDERLNLINIIKYMFIYLF